MTREQQFRLLHDIKLEAARRIEQRRRGNAVAGAVQHVHSGEDDVASLAEDLLGSKGASPSGEDGNTFSVAEEELDSRESPCCPKAQQVSKDQPVEASTKEVPLDSLSSSISVVMEYNFVLMQRASISLDRESRYILNSLCASQTHKVGPSITTDPIN